MDYTAEANRFRIGKRVVEFPYPVDQVVETEKGVVVRLEVPPRHVYTRNVFLVSFDGKILWQIEDPFTTEPLRSWRLEGRDPGIFSGVFLNDDGRLITHQWLGALYEIDLRTGSIRFLEYMR